ncbi:phosphatidate cytidylyltransferase [[Acholeplasma] multilocale]|uniref:phosphatidate cytidylyltransferase n=1 Tax=[Acholeplasma] multilocale TaxID=264638 RepID=UPI0006867C6E|nr:phosphatidate cytidylyltransferase [[Acholeplasma] multilocale]
MGKLLFKNKDNQAMEPKKVKTDLQVRLYSAIVMVILMAIYLALPIIHTELLRGEINDVVKDIPGYIAIIITSAIIGMSIFEINRVLGIKVWYHHATLIAAAIFVFIMPMGTWTTLSKVFLYRAIDVPDMATWWVSLLIILALVVIIFGVFKWAENASFKNVFISFAITIVIVFAMKGFSNISLSVEPENFVGTGNELAEYIPTYSFTSIIWIWSTIIFTDTFAYLGGRKFGKNKLAPKISPKKTWEGAIIGSSVAIALGIIFTLTLFYVDGSKEYAPFYKIFEPMESHIGSWAPGFLYVILTVLISILGQMGDLMFSAIKRMFGIKDYSNLIPGHGGVLDRLDSFMLVFFVMFFITFAMN